MIFVDDILTYFRNLGHAAEYGTLAQLNEQLTNVDYAASTDGMVAFVRLIGEQRTVDGHDQCDIAVHLSWLCPLDFDGETLLSTQEQAKDTLKEWINHIRGGNTVTVSEDARWQFGYDDFAENVAWVAVRVTLTAAAADCVPLSPEPPTPPEPTYQYNIFCPQFMWIGYAEFGQVSPMFKGNSYYVTVAVERTPALDYYTYVMLIGNQRPNNLVSERGTISEEWIQNRKTAMAGGAYPMTSETENWLRERIGKTFFNYRFNGLSSGHTTMLAAYNSSHYESKDITVI